MKHFFRKRVQKLTKSSMHCHCMPAHSIFSCCLLFVCIRLRFILWINNNRLFIGIILISVNYYRYFMCSTMCISKNFIFGVFDFANFKRILRWWIPIYVLHAYLHENRQPLYFLLLCIYARFCCVGINIHNWKYLSRT